jgi:membrane-associated phospholipid phosphatase
MWQNVIFVYIKDMKILDYIGFFGPQILLFVSIILLKNKSTLLYIYLLGMFLSMIINYGLKGLIREPRPSEDVHIFNMELNSSNLNGKRLGFDRFGMPSGHAQSVFFSTAFIYFALKNVKISLFYLLISLNTLYQRVKYKNHSIGQVIIGSLVGSVIAYAFFRYAKHILKRELKEKPDDDAPI